MGVVRAACSDCSRNAPRGLSEDWAATRGTRLSGIRGPRHGLDAMPRGLVMNRPVIANPWSSLMALSAGRPDGLDTVSTVLLALMDGTPVPARAAGHLAQALRPCLDGDNDIAARLGLRAPKRGRPHEAPANLAKKLRRDELIRQLVSDMGPPRAASALAVEILWLYYRTIPPRELQGTGSFQPKSLPLIAELVRDHGKPLSRRQIERIARGDPAYAQRKK